MVVVTLPVSPIRDRAFHPNSAETESVTIAGNGASGYKILPSAWKAVCSIGSRVAKVVEALPISVEGIVSVPSDEVYRAWRNFG
jgi:hypothetical protein